MSQGSVLVIYGQGKGKTSAALGFAVQAACHEGSVVAIEFLRKKDTDEIDFLGRLEPEIRIFRFQKSARDYAALDEQERQEERKNMINGLGYARKVFQTGECNKLILDEVLGLVDYGIVPEEKLIELLDQRPDDTEVILTGRVLGDRLREYADNVIEIRAEKERKEEENNADF